MKKVKEKTKQIYDKHERVFPLITKLSDFQGQIKQITKMNDILLSTFQDYDVSLKYYGLKSNL